MTTPKTLLTAEDLLRISARGKRCELLKGELVEMAPSGSKHGRITSKLAQLLRNHVDPRSLGEIFGAETGFRLERNPDTVRAPDAAFISSARLPKGELPEGYLDLAPDLAIEVVSPSDSAPDVQAKVEQWLRSGTRLVWVIYPNTRSVAVYRSLQDVRVMTSNDILGGEPVLPEFSCPVRDLF